MRIALGGFLAAGALFGVLALLSEDRDPKTYQMAQRYPEVCEQYVRAFEACGADASELSLDLVDNRQVGEGSASYIQRQLLQLRRELAYVRAEGGDQALFFHCQSAQFADINYRLVRQMASFLLEMQVMRAPCASAVNKVIWAHNDPTTSAKSLEELELSNTVATIAATPNKR
jgi:hypothetical protein